MKKIFKIFSILLFFCLTLTIKVKASDDDYVYLGGDSIGIKMQTGVYVIGKYQVQTDKGKISPWKNADIELGDKIESINGIKIENNAQLLAYLKNYQNENVKLTINRNNKMIYTNTAVIKNNEDENSIGLYIRDQILGIGTMTFVTADNYFGSLGHGIYENKVLVNGNKGNLYYSNVSSIKKATPGVAGEKRASIDSKIIGNIIKNDLTGLYGVVNNKVESKNKIKIASQNEITKGNAQIYTTIDGNAIKKYDIEIIDVDLQKTKSTKGIHFKVVDQELIEKTGGIIQGMSGSPIVQNGKIIGAVSHVTVENPIYGYGMHIEWMLEEVNNLK